VPISFAKRSFIPMKRPHNARFHGPGSMTSMQPCGARVRSYWQRPYQLPFCASGGPGRFRGGGSREAHAGKSMSILTADLKFACRMAMKTPWMTGASVVALGAAMAVAIFGFSLMWDSYFAELPFEQGDRIVAVRDIELPDPDDTPPRLAVYREWSERQRGLDVLVASVALVDEQSIDATGEIVVPAGAIPPSQWASLQEQIRVGADRGRILGAVLRRGLLQIGIGLLFGTVAGGALLRLMQYFPTGVASEGTWMLAAASMAMLVAGLLACLGPASRSVAVHPVVALRHR